MDISVFLFLAGLVGLFIYGIAKEKQTRLQEKNEPRLVVSAASRGRLQTLVNVSIAELEALQKLNSKPFDIFTSGEVTYILQVIRPRA